MKPTKLNDTNYDRLQAAFAEANGAARVRLTDADDVYHHAAAIEAKLSKLLYKKDWAGLTVRVNPHAQQFPGAYKGIPEATQFDLEFRSTGAYVVGVVRMRCGSRPYEIHGLDEKGAALAKFAISNF